MDQCYAQVLYTPKSVSLLTTQNKQWKTNPWVSKQKKLQKYKITYSKWNTGGSELYQKIKREYSNSDPNENKY
jgi:hypothetical protein